VLIVAGEASGEMYAAELVNAIRARTKASPPYFFGCGGEQMRRSGVETQVDIHNLAVLGPIEAVSHFMHLYNALHLLVKEAENRRPWPFSLTFQTSIFASPENSKLSASRSSTSSALKYGLGEAVVFM